MSNSDLQWYVCWGVLYCVNFFFAKSSLFILSSAVAFVCYLGPFSKLDLSWGFYGISMGFQWNFYGTDMGILWCYGIAMEFLQNFFAMSDRFAWDFYGMSVEFQWHFMDFPWNSKRISRHSKYSKGLLWGFYDMSMPFLRDFYGISTELTWDFQDVSMGSLWDFKKISLQFLQDFYGISWDVCDISKGFLLNILLIFRCLLDSFGYKGKCIESKWISIESLLTPRFGFKRKISWKMLTVNWNQLKSFLINKLLEGLKGKSVESNLIEGLKGKSVEFNWNQLKSFRSWSKLILKFCQPKATPQLFGGKGRPYTNQDRTLRQFGPFAGNITSESLVVGQNWEVASQISMSS